MILITTDYNIVNQQKQDNNTKHINYILYVIDLQLYICYNHDVSVK